MTPKYMINGKNLLAELKDLRKNLREANKEVRSEAEITFIKGLSTAIEIVESHIKG